MGHSEGSWRDQSAIFVLLLLVFLGAVAGIQADNGLDVTVPMFDVFPPAILVQPESGETDQTRPGRAASYEEEVLELTNIEGWNSGQLSPLKGNGVLDSSSGFTDLQGTLLNSGPE